MKPTIIPKLESLEQAFQMTEAALKKPEAYQHLLSIHRALWLEVIDDRPAFQVHGQLRLFVEFNETWRWFRHWGIDDDDIKDVYERALVLVPQVLSHPLPEPLKTATSADNGVRKALEEELKKISGYTDFIEFARRRLDEVLQMPKYKGLDRDNPEFT